MSYVSVSGVTDLNGLVGYLYFGKDDKTKYRRQNGITRAVQSFCTIPLGHFVDYGNNLQIAQGYKLSAVSIVQSFNNDIDHLDYKNPVDRYYINCLGRELAQKIYKNSEVLVVTHVDGKHHHIHNHIVVLNQDILTHKAVSTHLLRDIRNANDELMKEHDMNVIPKPSEQEIIKTFATKKNEEKHDKTWLRQHDFDTILQQKLNQVLLLKPTSMNEFGQLLSKAGVNYQTKGVAGNNDQIIIGLTYYMQLDGDRKRRRKASRLGNKYLYNSLLNSFHEAQKEQLTVPFVQKLKVAENLNKNPFITLPKWTSNVSKLADKTASNEQKTQQQVTTADNTLSADERLQVQKQRQFFVNSKLSQLKRKLKADLKRKYKKELQKIEDDKLAKTNKYWARRQDGSLTDAEYSDLLDQFNNEAGNAKQKATKRYKSEQKQIDNSTNKEVKQAKQKFEEIAKQEITKPDSSFDKKQKDLHKDYLEKSLNTDNKTQRNHKKHNKKRSKPKKDLNADGIDDEQEATQNVIQVDGGYIPLDSFDTGLGDSELKEFTTHFNNGVADTSAKTEKPFVKPKTQKKKKAISDDRTLQNLISKISDQQTEPQAHNDDDFQY